MLLLHVDLERLLGLVVQVTLGALQGLAGVVGGVPAEAPESVVDHHVVLQGLAEEDPGAAWSRVERAGQGRIILGHSGHSKYQLGIGLFQFSEEKLLSLEALLV